MKIHLTLLIIFVTSWNLFAENIPTRWLEGERGFEKALELQKSTKLPILVWATWSDCPNCSKVTSYLNTSKPKKALREYIRVIIDEHGKPAEVALAKQHNFTGGSFFILAPSSTTPVDRLWAWEPGEGRKIIPEIETPLLEKLAAAKP